MAGRGLRRHHRAAQADRPAERWCIIGSKSSPLRAELIAALRALEQALASGPERAFGIIRCVGGSRVDWKKYPHAVAVKNAAMNVRRLLRGGGKKPEEWSRDLVDDSIAPGEELLAILSFLDEKVDNLTRLPASRAMLRELAGLIVDLGGPKPKRRAIPMTEEDRAILEELANEYPSAVTQPDLATVLNLPRQKISERIRWLESKRFVKRPEGTQRKGHAIAPAGLSAIGRLSPH